MFDKKGGRLPRRDLHACRLQHLQDLGLTHLPCVGHPYHPRSHLWPKLAMVSCWRLCQIRPLVPRRVEFCFAALPVAPPHPATLTPSPLPPLDYPPTTHLL